MGLDYVSIFLGFLGGFGLFIYGMHAMASGLQKTAGGRMKKLLEALTSNKLLAVLIGTLVTAIIQSSSATTVMIVGFVNAGIMDLSQSVGVIMGANIGTTVTAWLVSLLETLGGDNASNLLNFFSPSTLAPFATVFGAFMVLLFKKKSTNQKGEILVGLGILFLGMTIMTTSLKPLSQSELFVNAFKTLGSNPLYGLLAGLGVTAVIQSSSASIGILQSLAMAGIVPWNAAIYIIMGQNIGTCVTAILSSIGATRNAKAAAYIHLLFNLIGCGIFTVLSVLFFSFINPNIGNIHITATAIAVVHTLFNIANTIAFYPFTDRLISAAKKMAHTERMIADEGEVVHLDDRVLETPTFAIQSLMKEIDRYAHLSLENLELATECLFDADSEKIERVYAREVNIDSLDKAITNYMVKICNTNISEEENQFITLLFHTINDIERVGDHSENIAELAELYVEEGASFSDRAVDELSQMIGFTVECFHNSIDALKKNDMELAERVVVLESQIDDLEKKFRAGHIARLSKNECDSTSGVIFLDTLTNLERISDHALNIAEFVMQQKHPKPQKTPQPQHV